MIEWIQSISPYNGLITYSFIFDNISYSYYEEDKFGFGCCVHYDDIWLNSNDLNIKNKDQFEKYIQIKINQPKQQRLF